MEAETSKTNGIQGQNSVPNSEGYFAEAESLEETENVPSLQILDSRTEESTEKSGQFEYDGLNFQNMSIADFAEREFAKVEEAERFYCNYALAIGFSIRRSRLRRSKGGVVMGRQWVCSKEGSRSKKWTNRDDMVRTPRKETRENCHATFAVKYCPKRDTYIVTKIVKEHSHGLANSREVPFLRSHRCVTESNIAQSMSMRKASIKTNWTYDYMVDQAGGYMKWGSPVRIYIT